MTIIVQNAAFSIKRLRVVFRERPKLPQSTITPAIYGTRCFIYTIFLAPEKQFFCRWTYANAMNRPTMLDSPMPASKSHLLASEFPAPGKVAGLGLVVLEPPLEVLLGEMGIPVLPELPEPLEELFVSAAPSGGVMFSGADFASSANDVMVRDWF